VITLGIDPSLSGLGWCVHNSSVAGSGRVIAKGRFTTPASRVFYWRYMYLREAVRVVLQAHPEVQAVGVESPPIGETFSMGLFGLFLYVNEAVMVERRDVVYFDPLRVKLLAKMDPNVRQGTMDKSDMVDIARQDTGVKRWNNDEADAYIIARSTARFFDLHAGRITAAELTAAEEQVFRSVHVFSRGKHAGKTEERGILFKEGERFYRFSALKSEELEIEINPHPRKGKAHA
jgi:Holliday junction resolvasome RuvABC endonuclease subunit